MSVAVGADVTFVHRAPEALFSLGDEALFLSAFLSTYDIAPDGERFLFLQASATATADDGGVVDGFVVVQNWFEELRRLVPVP